MGGGVPEGWARRAFTDIADVWFSGVDKKSEIGERPIRLCNYMDVFHNVTITDDLPFMEATATDREIADCRLQPGDVVFTKDSETADQIAECALVKAELPDLVCGYHLGIARPLDGEMEGAFLAQALRGAGVRAQFSKVANGVVRFGLTLDAMEEIELPVPPRVERTRIATVLDAWDRAIAAAERAAGLARVRADGLRANLLGRRQSARAGDNLWAAREFGEITDEETRRNNGALGADRVMGVLKSEGLVPMRAHVMASDLTRYKRVPPAAFAYNPMRLNIGSIAMSAHAQDVLVSPDYVVFSVRETEADPRLIRHLTRTRAWSDHLARTGSGSVRTRIYYDDLAELVVFLPPRAEQTRIADILDDADRTVDDHTRQATLLRTQKRALMQRLLTGAQRLGPEFDAHLPPRAADAA